MTDMLGNKIKTLRKSKGLTQKQLSELANVSEIAIKKYENNILNPKYSTLEKIADALSVSVFEFLGSEDQIKKQFEEHFNIPQEVDTALEIKTMLTTSDKKLAISSMLHTFKCFKDIIPDSITYEDWDLLAEVITTNITSTISMFKNINSGLLKQITKVNEENTEIKNNNKTLNQEVLALENNIKQNIIYEPFKSLEDQEAFEKSLEADIENGYFDKEDS